MSSSSSSNTTESSTQDARDESSRTSIHEDVEMSSDSEESSILSPSSSEDSDSDSDDHSMNDTESIPTISTRQKPTIQPLPTSSHLGDLEGRLKSFLPALKAANEATFSSQHADDKDGQGLELEEGKEGERYISMELGLGVLEEKDPNQASESEESEGEDDDDEEEEEEERDVMARLKGQRREKRETKRPDITEVS